MPEDNQHEKERYGSHKKLYVCISVFAILAAAIGIYVAHRANNNQNTLPKSIISQIDDFTPFYFANDKPPHQLRLKPGSASYSNNVLVFSLTDSKGQTIALTEQKLPAEFVGSVLQGEQKLSTAYGSATLNNIQDGRTTGSLVTKDKTFILLNTPDPVEIDTIKDVLRALRPL